MTASGGERTLANLTHRVHARRVSDRDEQLWRLYGRATEILEGRRNGHARPILQMLAARGFPPALNHLGDFVRPGACLRLLRRAAATGDVVSLYNLAVERRNRGDMQGYRYWLARAARTDADAHEELRRFRTRFPEPCMKRWGRFAAVR